MKHIYKFLSPALLIAIVSVSSGVNGQEGTIRGKVVDSENGSVVEYAYILNYSLDKSIYGNTAGEFKLGARQGDTLVMYALGYFYQKVIVEDAMIGSGQAYMFRLARQPVQYAEARIVGLGTYEDFKRNFLSLKQAKTKTDRLADYLADISQTAAREAYSKAKDEQKLDGITFASVPILTPEEKERIKLAGIKEKEQVRDQIYQKYNPKVIKTVTGMTEDDEIIEFMVYCNFSDAYLLEVNDYDLMTRIALKYEMFKRKKLDEKSMENPVNQIDEVFYPNA